MKNLRRSVGIDMAKNEFYGCISVINDQSHVKIKATKKFDNTAKGFDELKQWVEKSNKKEPLPCCYVMEATGVYYEQLAWYLYNQQIHVAVVLPNKAKNYMKSLGLRSKNDTIDAKGLARMGAEQYLKPWSPISKDIYKLRSLTRHLEHLNKTKTCFNNQLHAIDYGMYEAKTVRKSLQQTIKEMDRQIEKTKNEIGKIIENDPVLSKKAASMTSVKGISTLSIASIIAETNGFELFNSQKQLTSYAGYDVVENQSGNKAGKTRISKKGNAHIRRSMYFPALNVIRYQVEPFYGLYKRIYERTKCKMKAITAVQRKLLILMYTLWKSEQQFNSKFQDTSGNHEPKHPSFRVISPGGLINKQPLIVMSGCSRWTSVQTIA